MKSLLKLPLLDKLMKYLYAVSIKQLVWFALFFILALSDRSSGQSLSDAERLPPGTRFFVTSDLHRLREQIPKTSVYRLWQSPELGQFWTFAKSAWLEAVLARYPKEQKVEKPTAYHTLRAKELLPLLRQQIDRFAGPMSIAIVENSSAHRAIASLIIVHLLKDGESTDIIQSVFQSQIDAGEMRIEAQQETAGNPFIIRLLVSDRKDADSKSSTARESVGYATVLNKCLVLASDLPTMEQLLARCASPDAPTLAEDALFQRAQRAVPMRDNLYWGFWRRDSSEAKPAGTSKAAMEMAKLFARRFVAFVGQVVEGGVDETFYIQRLENEQSFFTGGSVSKQTLALLPSDALIAFAWSEDFSKLQSKLGNDIEFDIEKEIGINVEKELLPYLGDELIASLRFGKGSMLFDLEWDFLVGLEVKNARRLKPAFSKLRKYLQKHSQDEYLAKKDGTSRFINRLIGHVPKFQKQRYGPHKLYYIWHTCEALGKNSSFDEEVFTLTDDWWFATGSRDRMRTTLDQLANPIASPQSGRFERPLTYWGDVQGVLYIDFKSVVRFIIKWLVQDSDMLQRLDALFDQYLFEITAGFSADDQGTRVQVRSPMGMFWLPWLFSVK